MRRSHQLHNVYSAELTLLERDHLMVLELEQLDDLLREPEGDPFAPRRGPARSGLDDAALTLGAAEALPPDLTVRVVLPPGAQPSHGVDVVQAAFQRDARDAASVAQREAVSVRNIGRSDKWAGVAAAVIAAVVAYGVAALASAVDGLLLKFILLVTAGLSISVAWVVSWMVIEWLMIDWRESARSAACYQLLARATVEVVVEPG